MNSQILTGKIIYNGESYNDRLVLLSVKGSINPVFITTSIPDRNIMKKRAQITESKGSILISVDNISLIDYMRNTGFTIEGTPDALSLPLMIYYTPNSDPVAAGIYIFNDDGSAVCGSYLPVGAQISIGSIDKDGIMETAVASIKKITDAMSEKGKSCGAIIYTCLTRFLMLAPDREEELRLIRDKLDIKSPYTLAYSGGEICPVMDENGVYQNRFHNFTFSALIL
jgi:hypothetical protein